MTLPVVLYGVELQFVESFVGSLLSQLFMFIQYCMVSVLEYSPMYLFVVQYAQATTFNYSSICTTVNHYTTVRYRQRFMSDSTLQSIYKYIFFLPVARLSAVPSSLQRIVFLGAH